MDGVTRIKLTELVSDQKAWPRWGLDHQRVTEFRDLYLVEGLEALPPIEVVRGSGTTRALLCDGWHRLAALSETTATEVLAIVHALPEGEEAVAFAYRMGLARSAVSSKPLTRAEKREAIRRLVAERPEASDRAIGRLVGVDHKTVARVRTEDDGPASPGATFASVSPEAAAKRLFRAFEKAYEARGLGIADYFKGDRTGERLAAVLSDSYEERALERARQFRDWLDQAIAALDGGAP